MTPACRHVEVHRQEVELTDRYYMACECGACGPLRRRRETAETEAELHRRGAEPRP